MRVLPVIDLKNRLVVRGVEGRRAEYQPVSSVLVSSSCPADIARAIRDQLGLTEIYVADLDALAGAAPDLATLTELQDLGFRLWVDAGLRDTATATPLANAGVSVLVAGLETLRGPEALTDLLRNYGSRRLVFSLDLKHGRPLGDLSHWEGTDAWSVATAAIAAGVRRLLVLDLSRVGTGAGTGTEELCARLAAAHPQVELAAGGGVRGPDDLQRLANSGVQIALVASALHDGRLTPAHLAAL